MYSDFYDHPALDDYWKQKGFYTAGNYKLMKDVPTYFLTGWYDYFGAGVLEDFMALVRSYRRRRRSCSSALGRTGPGRSTCGDAFYGDTAAIDQNALALDWFDHFLKGRDLRLVGPEPVRLFRMGGGDRFPDRRQADARRTMAHRLHLAGARGAACRNITFTRPAR